MKNSIPFLICFFFVGILFHDPWGWWSISTKGKQYQNYTIETKDYYTLINQFQENTILRELNNYIVENSDDGQGRANVFPGLLIKHIPVYHGHKLYGSF